jgi:hypothetical protein
MVHKVPPDPQFHPGGRLRCEECAAHSQSHEGRETRKLFSLVYELAGYGPTPEHPLGRAAAIPEELHLIGPYYQAYHDRGHLSYAELGLEDIPPAAA